MENIGDYLSIAVFSILLIGIFIFCGWVIYRHWINKEWISPAARYYGEDLYMKFQNEDKKAAIEHVLYQREEEREEVFCEEDADTDKNISKHTGNQ